MPRLVVDPDDIPDFGDDVPCQVWACRNSVDVPALLGHNKELCLEIAVKDETIADQERQIGQLNRRIAYLEAQNPPEARRAPQRVSGHCVHPDRPTGRPAPAAVPSASTAPDS
jgi:hypothetical protein